MTRDEIWDYCKRKHYSAGLAQFWMERLVCEACHRESQVVHHIRTRGAGGDDDALNLMALCVDDHTRIHSLGVRRFGFLYPALRDKMRRALDRPKGGT